MIATSVLRFDQPALRPLLDRLSIDELDALDFGVLGFDVATVVGRYNRYESHAAGLRSSNVLGRPLFKVVAPCMDNFMVSQRFEDALAESSELDAIVPYVLTLRMRPAKVRLRLLASPDAAWRYVLVDRGG